MSYVLKTSTTHQEFYRHVSQSNVADP